MLLPMQEWIAEGQALAVVPAQTLQHLAQQRDALQWCSTALRTFGDAVRYV